MVIRFRLHGEHTKGNTPEYRLLWDTGRDNTQS